MSTPIPSFDELLNNIMTDYRNLGGNPNAEQFIRASCLAAALWGAYKHQQQVERNIFPDTADLESLLHHGSVAGLTLSPGETQAAFLARLQDNDQRPPAGGNQYDYATWAKEISDIVDAYVFPLAQGNGTVDVVPITNAAVTGSEIPSNSSKMGNATSVSAGKLNDTAGDFSGAINVSVGDLVENPAKRKSTTVKTVNSGQQLTLNDDIFKFRNEGYIIYTHTGTATSVAAGSLVDTSGNFTRAAGPVVAGDLVENLDTAATAKVLAVTDQHTVSLDTDIFTAGGQRYVVRSKLGQIAKNIGESRPVCASRVSVVAPTIQSQDVALGVSGTGINRTQIQSDITAYLSAMAPGQPLYIAQLISLAIQNGAENVLVSTPSADVVANGYAMIRPGTVTVS